MTSKNGNAQTVTDAASITAYGKQETALGWPHNDLLLQDDGDVRRLIRAVLAQQKSDYLGVSQIEVDADQDPVRLFGILSQMASTGIGNQATLTTHWVHPSGETVDTDLKMIGCHFVLTMEGGQAKFTGEVRTAKN